MRQSFCLDQMASRGAAPCLLTAEGAVVSYEDMAGRARGFARRLGGGRKLVALEAVAEPEMIAALIGAWDAGHAVALLPADDRAAMERFRRDYAPEAVFARQGGRWRLLLDGTGVGMGGGAEVGVGALHPDLALILMTSGSTGHGKAVRLSAAAVAANARSIGMALGLRPADRAALVLPLHYSFGLSVLTSHLAAGASVWLARGGVMAEGFLPALRARGVTNLQTVPMGFDLLERAGFAEAPLPDLRFLAVAGGALAVDRQRRFQAVMAARGGQFHAMYGQTEAVARIACLPPELAAARAGCIGDAIPGGSLTLRDEAGREGAVPGAMGELVYRGPNVMMGYAETRADLARGAEVEALATGDIARCEAEGMFRIIGRKRRMSKIAGVRIGHDAIEAALAERGLAAAVFGGDQGLVVAFEGAGNAEKVAAMVAGIAGVLRGQVDALAVAVLPRLSSGKIDYSALAALARPARLGGVVAAYRAAFHPVAVGMGDSFARLGGDSLRHVELALALERDLGRLPEGWERMPLGALQRMEPAEAARTAGGEIATELAVRAAAILAVVVTHETLWPVYGGAAAMVVLIGLMLARFQQAAMVAGDVGLLLRPLGRVLLPYYLILAGYALHWGQVPWGSLMLISNFGIGDPATQDRLPFLYWFVEAYAQMLVLLAGVVMVPGVRRAVARDPFRAGLLALAGAVGLRLFGADALGLGGRKLFTVPWVLYLAVFGWLIGTAVTRRQKWAVLGLAAVVMPGAAYLGGNWHGAWLKYGCILGVVALLLFVPRLRCPAWLRGPVLAVAASSYLIYLTHRLWAEGVMAGWEAALPGWAFSALAMGGGVLLGIGLTAMQRALARRWQGWQVPGRPWPMRRDRRG